MMLMDPVAINRDQMPGSDVNFNSPGHRSSQDGSFIQDDADMHLILDFDGGRNGTHPGLDPKFTGSYCQYQPTSVLTSSWINRRQSKWATDFDANIAELDFDNVATRDILAIGAATDSYWKTDMKDWNQNRLAASLRTSMMEGSLDLSLSRSTSLFSSTGDPETRENTAEELLMANLPAFISTDSLDLSSLAVESEHIRNVCATKKGDYVLTYEQPGPMTESGLAESVPMGNYQDAHLSNACDTLDRLKKSVMAESNRFTTWGRIRRSYELSFNDAAEEEGKSRSLPNLSKHQNRNQCSGAGERMLSACDHALPIYDLAQSMSESSHYQSCFPEEKSERLSLLKMYRNKLYVMGGGDNLLIPSENGEMGDSSGYATGGNGATTESAPEAAKRKTRQIPESETAGENNQSPDFVPRLVQIDDHDYAEFFVNGRYIDINHNEIGFIPPSTQGLQRTSSSVHESADIPKNQRAQFCLNNSTATADGAVADTQNRWAALASPRLTKVAPAKPPRTFATLLETSLSRGRGFENESDNEGTLVSPRQNLAEPGRLKNSGTQVPMYVMDRSVQTTCWDSGKLITTVVTTSVCKANDGKPIYTGRLRAVTTPTMSWSNYDNKFGGVPKSELEFDGDLPDLSFLKMPFDVPSLFPSCLAFPLALLTGSPDLAPNLPSNKGEEIGFSHRPISALPVSSNQVSVSAATNLDFAKFPFPTSTPFDKFLLGCDPAANGKTGLPSPPSRKHSSHAVERSFCELDSERQTECVTGGVTRDRDSGLGSSGPSHIQDWESLATLLPKDVVQACSFFKANSQLLTRSQQGTRDCGGSNIDKPHRVGGCGRARQSRSSRSRPVSEPACERHSRMGRFESIREEAYEDYDKAFRSEREEMESVASFGCFHQPSNCPMVEQKSVKRRHYSSCPAGRVNAHHYHYHHHYHHCCHRRCESEESRRNNLKRWNACRLNCRNCRDYESVTESESEESEIETWQKGKDLRRECSCRQGRRPSTGSSTEDEDECLGDSYFLPGAMTSEYRLRSNKEGTAAEPRRFLSLQNVRDYHRQRGSFLSDQQSSGPRTASYGQAECWRACATCFRVRSPTSARPPLWAIAAEEKTKEVFCDCQTSDILEEIEEDKRRRPGRRLVNFFNGFPSSELSDEEIALQNTDLYKNKKAMVSDVVQACDIVVSVFSRARKSTGFKVENIRLAVSEVIKNSLCPAVGKILADGLLNNYSIWDVVQASATLGPATRSIHGLVTDLNCSAGQNEGEHSLRFLAFINGLLNLRSLDCWLSYLVLKDRLLSDHYDDAGFLRRATTAYRNLFTQILVGIQPLSLLYFEQLHDISALIGQFTSITPKRTPRSSSVPAVTSRVNLEPELSISFRTPQHSGEKKEKYRLLPTKLPSDSRVPKSSSVPSRLCSPSRTPKSSSVDSGLLKLSGKIPSKIPVLMKASPSFPGATKRTEPIPSAMEFPSGSVMSISDQEELEEEQRVNNNKRIVAVVEESCGDRMRGFLPCKVGEKLELIQNCVVPGQQLLKCRKRVAGGWEEGFVQRRKISLLTCS